MTAPRRRRTRLPPQIANAVEAVAIDYHGFVAREITARGPEEPKDFSARHAAAKTALNHLEQLVKMVGADAEPEEAAALEQLLVAARADLGAAGEDPVDADPEPN